MLFYAPDFKMNRELQQLEEFKKDYLDGFLIPGKMYYFGYSRQVQNASANAREMMAENTIVIVTKLQVVKTIKLQQLGPAIVINLLVGDKIYCDYIYNAQIKTDMFVSQLQSLYKKFEGE